METHIQSDNGDNVQVQMYLNTLRVLSESTDDYLYLWELQSNRVWFFGEITKKYQLLQDGEMYCTADKWLEIVYPRDIAALSEEFEKIMRGDIMTHNMEYRLKNKKGRLVWIDCRGTVQNDAQGRPFVMIGRISEAVLRYKFDLLTGIFNANKLQEDLKEINPSMKDGFLMILGVDNLKLINIQKGRKYGNETLKFIAKVLEEVIENSQRIYKLDGDNFAVWIYRANSAEVQSVYDEIKEMAAPKCTLSAGAVSFGNCSEQDMYSLRQYAEAALDRAKKEGKNRLEFFSEKDYQKKVEELQLAEELKQSVENECAGFSLVYQSQIKLSDQQLYGAEALLRYESPTRGRIMPNDLIPLLEKTGLIYPVGDWVLRTALKQCSEWRKKMPDFHISVNMSYVQMKQPNITDEVLTILEESGVPGEALTLELTESMQIQDFQYFNSIFLEWGNAGIEISVDDFGTGYSNLGYLKYLKVDEIKIDRCFVKDIQHSSYNYQLLSSILKFASDTRIHVCCEGVEEKEELQVLEELKPDLLQGYFFSKPCEKTDFEKRYFI